MKRKELIAAVLFAAVLTGCTPGASKELAGNESSQEISIDNTVEAAIEASSEVVVEAPVEVSVDESVAEASVEEIKAERPEKANSDYPFLFIDINWDTSRNVSVYELGFKSGEESSVTSTLLSNSYGDTVVFQNCKGEEDFSMVFVSGNPLSKTLCSVFTGISTQLAEEILNLCGIDPRSFDRLYKSELLS